MEGNPVFRVGDLTFTDLGSNGKPLGKWMIGVYRKDELVEKITVDEMVSKYSEEFRMLRENVTGM